MVVALGPGRFYGSGLPRPRVFPGDRVDPPAPVTDPLLAWAREAHWSMGGLSSKRLRLQGRIEGNLVKIRRTARRDARVSAKAKSRAAGVKPASLDPLGPDDDAESTDDEADVKAQEKVLRRELVDDEEDSGDSGESSDEEEVALVTIAAAAARRRNRARKLVYEFDRVAAPQEEGGRKKKPSAVAPAKKSLKRKAVSAKASVVPAAEAPAKKSLKRKAAAEVVAAPAPRRTSPRSKN